MGRRVCLAHVANDILPVIMQRLPANVAVTAKVEVFDSAITVLRLEGGGLPEWCEEPPGGSRYEVAVLAIGSDGSLHFLSVSRAYRTLAERLVESYSNQN